MVFQNIIDKWKAQHLHKVRHRGYLFVHLKAKCPVITYFSHNYFKTQLAKTNQI